MRVSIIGPGSFGTALAQITSKNTEEVYLFGRNRNVIDSINNNGRNEVYFPLNQLNDNIKAFHLKDDVALIDETDVVILSVPSGVLSGVIQELRPYLKDKIVISSIKGIDYPSLKFMTELIKTETANDNVFSISGPTFADELINNILSALTIGIDNPDYKKPIGKLFHSPSLFTDFSSDVRGVEFCGVLKNVYAVALGIFDSQFYGNNSHYAFLNLCFKEMRTLLDEMGYDVNLSNNFCGFGDFNLTACVDKSRNRTLGLMIGKDIALDFENSTITMEGFRSAMAIQEITRKIGKEFPIINFVNKTFQDRKYVKPGLNSLLNEVKKS
ncbi:Glycerol-3-phosphate dehydrogenase [NAD(P)+] [Methanobacterium sp. MB1]|jgi:glycerol-3-phosphate dehydrogenase (NAD(P)+)|uniref:NAD(P)H-dependent glycerol-3-phosphate dehydrogenase n=1 Tax=Methanobacterium sp. TaxID=2164 RepID=UPI0003C9E73B|nr:NAD(P)H-dependent glycerol-3-phosphate dehydrogenase [uncultured Methanobacterium sp.]CDG65199.1 Glycerol-3-phosphate dehydrogenase [NAD(P)+] [Methanobacterium sp. MB1]